MKKFVGVWLGLSLVSAIAFAQESVSSSSGELDLDSPSGESVAYANNLKMREARRVGVGTQLGGTSGTLGLHMELNIEDENSALAAFGMGDGFSTFSISWKHQFEGDYLTPYTTVGWSRWYNSSGTAKPQSYVLDGNLTNEEKSTGRFGIDYIAAGGGVQYNQLEGDFAGASLFAELELLVPPFRSGIVPGASVGATYFF